MKMHFAFPMGEENEKGECKTFFADLGVIVDGGEKVFLKGMTVYKLEKLTQEQFEEMMNDYDDIEAPPGPYKLQPENQGKLLWLSGAPGMGKSTTAQYLARDHGFVYYEGDCFGALKNPFNTVDSENPSMDQVKQRNLNGPGAGERAELMKAVMPAFQVCVSFYDFYIFHFLFLPGYHEW